MEIPLLLATTPASCSALSRGRKKNLAGKAFAFPRRSLKDYVKLSSSRTSLDALTVRLRFFTDGSQGGVPFSLAPEREKGQFVIGVPGAQSRSARLRVRGRPVTFARSGNAAVILGRCQGGRGRRFRPHCVFGAPDFETFGKAVPVDR